MMNDGIYRVLIRRKGKSEVLADDVDLETAYRIIVDWGKGTSKHFTIERIIRERFSALTAREAMARLEKGEV